MLFRSGVGEAITIAFTMNPSRRANTLPIARVPKTGDAGWAIQLTEGGQIIFRVGSSARHQAVVADADYQADRPTHVACVFDHGNASIFVNGALKKTARDIPFSVRDTTAAGRLGSVSNLYEAVGDVIVRSDEQDALMTKSILRYRNYAGALRDIRVYNRALAAKEILELMP